MPRAITLLVLDAHKLVRADFTRGGGARAMPQLRESWQQPRPDIDDLSLLVEAAASQGGKLRGTVWILWSDLFAHSLHLDARALGVQGDELQRTLAFEAEALSGVTALEGVVAYRQTAVEKGEREFWVLQARQMEIELLRDTVARLGGKLAGITSTSGPDLPIAGDSEVADTGDEKYREWLAACAAALTHEPSRPTAITPPTRPLAAGQRWLLALGLAMPLALACWVTSAYVAEPRIAALKEALKMHQAAKERVAGIDKQLTELAKQKAHLEKRTAELRRAVAVLETQRSRVAGLLQHLSTSRTDDLLVMKIDSTAGEPTVHGLCLKPDVAPLFAHRLGEKTLALGWHAEAPKSQGQHLLANGGPWSFELHLKDVLAPTELVSKTNLRAKK